LALLLLLLLLLKAKSDRQKGCEKRKGRPSLSEGGRERGREGG